MDAHGMAVLKVVTSFLSAVGTRIAKNPNISSHASVVSAGVFVLTTQMLVNAFSSPIKTGAKEET